MVSSYRYKILQPTDRKLRGKNFFFLLISKLRGRNLKGTECANTKNAEHT
jgi:hypothetical protein